VSHQHRWSKRKVRLFASICCVEKSSPTTSTFLFANMVTQSCFDAMFCLSDFLVLASSKIKGRQNAVPH
jgi:hypothetical protein